MLIFSARKRKMSQFRRNYVCVVTKGIQRYGPKIFDPESNGAVRLHILKILIGCLGRGDGGGTWGGRVYQYLLGFVSSVIREMTVIIGGSDGSQGVLSTLYIV